MACYEQGHSLAVSIPLPVPVALRLRAPLIHPRELVVGAGSNSSITPPPLPPHPHPPSQQLRQQHIQSTSSQRQKVASTTCHKAYPVLQHSHQRPPMATCPPCNSSNTTPPIRGCPSRACPQGRARPPHRAVGCTATPPLPITTCISWVQASPRGRVPCPQEVCFPWMGTGCPLGQWAQGRA